MLSQFLTYLRTILLTPANWLVSAGRWVRLSLPARVLVVLLLFVILVEVGYFIVLGFVDTDDIYFSSRLKTFLLPFLVILIALPVSAYYATKFWLETPPTDYPDIDEAWHLGVQAIGRAGLDLSDLPLYLTIGITDAKTADHMMQAANWELLVDGQPNGAHALRWYASDKAAMLFLLEASATSAVQSQSTVENTLLPGDLRGTMIGNVEQPANSRGIRGTIVAGSDSASTNRPTTVSSEASSGGGGGQRQSIKGTMIAGHAEPDANTGSPGVKIPQLGRQERALQSHRLARVCELAASSRLPYCPLNGLLSIVDWNLLLSSRDAQLSACIRSDYDALVQAGKTYVPMVVMVNGLDADPGFVELSRRVGEERVKNNRFGHGFNHLIPPESNQLQSLATHAAGAFEDWIYDLFRHPECLDRTNNEKLFSLLCRTRSELAPRLSELLASLASEGQSGRRLMLAGCYFGATGRNQSKQAFVRSVVEKLVELEDDIEWSDEALAAEHRLQGLLRLVVFLNALLVVFIIGVIAFKFFVTRA